jgi:hypothetical protein
MTAFIGWALLAMAVWPALSPRIETGVTMACGLGLVALSGLAMALDFGAHRRDVLALAGLALVVLGVLLQWRRGRLPLRPFLAIRRAQHRAGSRH